MISFNAFDGNQNDNRRTLIKLLLEKWHHNSPYKNIEIRIEINRDLSRGFTESVTFKADIIETGQNRISRVFKIDNSNNISNEAIIADELKQRGGRFFCRINNNPQNDQIRYKYVQNCLAKVYSIIEYEYVAQIGYNSNIYQLIDFLREKIGNVNDIDGEKISSIFDDVLQGLKAKVYTNFIDNGLQGTGDKYHAQIMSYNKNIVKRIIEDSQKKIKNLFGDDSIQDICNNIDNALKIHGNYYSVEYIHGDLNPSNILVYTDNAGSARGILIDFFEMYEKKNKSFTPYFWDFARLEGEIILSLFTDDNLMNLRNVRNSLENLIDSLLLMNPIKSDDQKLIAISDVLFRLRKSFFKTEGFSIAVQPTLNTLRTFYITLLVFYLFYLRYYGKPHESIQVPLALFIAHKIALFLIDIENKKINYEQLKEDNKSDELKIKIKELEYNLKVTEDILKKLKEDNKKLSDESTAIKIENKELKERIIELEEGRHWDPPHPPENECFKLDEDVFDILSDNGIPGHIIDNLKPLKNKYFGEVEFDKALENVIGKKESGKYISQIKENSSICEIPDDNVEPMHKITKQKAK